MRQRSSGDRVRPRSGKVERLQEGSLELNQTTCDAFVVPQSVGRLNFQESWAMERVVRRFAGLPPEILEAHIL